MLDPISEYIQPEGEQKMPADSVGLAVDARELESTYTAFVQQEPSDPES